MFSQLINLSPQSNQYGLYSPIPSYYYFNDYFLAKSNCNSQPMTAVKLRGSELLGPILEIADGHYPRLFFAGVEVNFGSEIIAASCFKFI